jgi:hypothetical protein
LGDEWGMMNIVVRPHIYTAYESMWKGMLLVVTGEVQRKNGVINVMARSVKLLEA